MNGDMARTRVKVCCIQSRDEARFAVALGADALGLVSEMPSGPGVIGEDRIATIAETVPPPVAAVLLTSRVDPAAIAEQARRCRVGTIQICDRLPAHGHSLLREELPGTKLIQVVHVTGEGSVEEAVKTAGDVDALLLDSGNPGAARRELGGTGRVHDWEVSRRIRDLVPVPVFLAGGLRPDNVAEAIRVVAPYGVDVCSGVRTDDRLDRDRLSRFMDAVAQAATRSGDSG